MLKQSFNLRLNQKLSPQQIQLMKMLQLSTLEFEQKLKQEIEENPALESEFEDTQDSQIEEYQSNDEFEETQTIDTKEVDIDSYLSDDEIPSYKTQTNHYSDDDEEYTVQQTVNQSLIDYLYAQLHTFQLDKFELEIADFLIGNIDDDGYIRRPITSLVDDFALYNNVFVDVKQFENCLINYVQKLEPIGVGARDLKECLLIQLKNKPQTKETHWAIEILTSYFDSFAKKNYQTILSKLKITESELKIVIQEIVKLNPKPGKAFASSTYNHVNFDGITPDFTLTIENNSILVVTLNNKNIPELRISDSYKEILDTYKVTKSKSTEQKKTVFFIKQKLDSAKGFIDMVKQRHETLLVFIQAIIDYQKEYFLTGNERELKPMILKDIANKTQMDVSTISRLVNSKYIATPYGTKLLKNLFSESLKNEEGEDISTKEIKNKLVELIETEDKKNPLTDDKILELLKQNGYQVARRTVAKYREQQNIPVARLRKEL